MISFEHIKDVTDVVADTFLRAFEVYVLKSIDLNLKVVYHEHQIDDELQRLFNKQANNLKLLKLQH
uniref:Uncharacterized protein n=1 Tax=Glossina palpalis gambiensis TaxID=67801 RepID=A0A1B0C559_9MUSC